MNTTTGIRIDLPLAELSHRKDVVCKECYVILQDKYIDYKVIATYSSDENTEEIWKEYKANYRWSRNRSDIADLFMFYDNVENLYTVGMEFHGIEDPVSWHWYNPKEALEVYNTLNKYRKEDL